MYSIHGKYELSDYRKAQALHIRRGLAVELIGKIALGLATLLALLGLVLSIFQLVPFFLVLPVIVFVAAYFAIKTWLLPYQVKRIFTQQRDLQSPFTFEIGENDLVFRNEYGEYRYPWSDFTKWKADADLIMLYRSDLVFQMLPRRLFNNPQIGEYVLERVNAHKVPNAAKVRNPLQTYVYLIVVILILVGLVIGMLNAR